MPDLAPGIADNADLDAILARWSSFTNSAQVSAGEVLVMGGLIEELVAARRVVEAIRGGRECDGPQWCCACEGTIFEHEPDCALVAYDVLRTKQERGSEG